MKGIELKKTNFIINRCYDYLHGISSSPQIIKINQANDKNEHNSQYLNEICQRDGTEKGTQEAPI